MLESRTVIPGDSLASVEVGLTILKMEDSIHARVSIESGRTKQMYANAKTWLLVSQLTCTTKTMDFC